MNIFHQKIVGFCFLGCLFILAASQVLGCGPANTAPTTIEQIVSVSAGQYEEIPVNLNSGDLLKGSFTVAGLTDLGIKFSIQDLSGTNVYGPVQSHIGSFSYLAQTTELYYLYLDNIYSATAKSISITYADIKRSAPALSILAVTPASLPNLMVGSSQQLNAIGTFSDGAMADVSPQVTWVCSNANIAYIS